MANLTVNIHPKSIDFDPEGPGSADTPPSATIFPGDVVTFALVDRSDAVTVTFSGSNPNSSSPFSTTTVQIAGGTQKLSAPKTVKSDVAASDTYHISAPELDPGKEQPGTLSGGLEVGATRPPEPPEK